MGYLKANGMFLLAVLVSASVATSPAFAQDETPSSSDSSNRTGLGLYVEPGVSYQQSKSSIDWPSPFSSSSGSVNGFGLSAKLGFHIADIFFAGADARYTRAQFKDSSVSMDSSSEGINYGVIGGIQTPVVGLRLWGGYVLGGHLDPAESNNVDFKFTNPKGYRVGVGMRVAIVSINFEYQSLKYDNTTVEKLGPFTPGSTFDNAKLTDNAYVASVSFPIDI